MTLGFFHANRLLYGIQSLPWLLKSLKHCVCICSESPFLLSLKWTFQFFPSRYMQFLSSAPVFFPERASFLPLIEIRFFEFCAVHPAFTSLCKSFGYLWSERMCKLCSDIFLCYILSEAQCTADNILLRLRCHWPHQLSFIFAFSASTAFLFPCRSKIKLFWLSANKSFFFDLSFVSCFSRFLYIRLYKLLKTLLLWSIFGCFRFFDYRSYLVFLTPDAFSWSGLTVFTFYVRERPNRIFEILCSKKTPSHFSPRGNLF